MKRKLAWLLCLILLQGALSAGGEAALTDAALVPVARKNGMTLLLDGRTGEIALEGAGYVWRSAVTEQCDLSALTPGQRAMAVTPMMVEYTLLNNRSDQSTRRALADMDLSVTHAPMADGVRVVYHAQEIALEITVEYTLLEDGLRVHIPADGIREGVGLEEKLAERMTAIRENLGWMRNVIAVMEADEHLTDHRKDIRRFGKAFERFAAELEGITTVVDVKNRVDKITALMTSCQSVYKGGVGETGLFSAIVADTRIDAETRKYYKQVYNQLDTTYTQTRLFTQQLTSLKYCAVTALSLLPCFGALGDQEDGYVFYPDGSGAISCASAEHPSYQHYFLEDVYTSDTPMLDDLLVQGDSGKQQVLMPVFGVRHGDSAYLAVIHEGAEHAAIEYDPSGMELNVHRVDAYLRCRRTAAVYDQGQSRGAIYELERFDTPYTVDYYFLQGADADYSGMACRYRAYLLTQGLLNVSPLTQQEGLVAVNLIMGVTRNGLLSRSFVPVTTFTQAEEIAAALRERGVDNVLFNLEGYTRDGYSQVPTLRAEAASALGGTKGLTHFCQSLDGTGMRVLLDNGYTAQVADGSEFASSDFAYDSTGTLMTDTQRRLFLLKPSAALDYLQRRQLPVYRSAGVDGITFESIAGYLYADGQRGAETTRGDTQAIWQRMLAESRQALGLSAAKNAGAYAFAHLDWISDAPDAATGYVFTDASVPFYQMVLHGYAVYSAKPVNKFYDTAYETLRMLEYGYMPVFDVTYAPTARLENSSCYDQFSTCFADWADAIADASRLAKEMSAVSGSAMVSHERRADGTVCVAYENGCRLVLNYGETPVTVDGVSIDGMGYHLFAEGRNGE